MTETVEGEAVELELREQHQPVTLFGTDDPSEVIAKATKMADALMNVVRSKQLAKRIGPKDYLLVEAWTCLGSMAGVFPRTVWTREIDNGYEAHVEAVTRDGAVVGAAEAICTRDERNWKGRDAYALKSMAQTRAMGKALRMPLGFIAVLAGFEATPAEEMPTPADDPALYTHAEITDPLPDPPLSKDVAGGTKIPSGPQKGKTIAEAYRENPGYITAIARSAKNVEVREAAQSYLDAVTVQADDPTLPF